MILNDSLKVKLMNYRNGAMKCPHDRTVTGLAADCFPCLISVVEDVLREVQATTLARAAEKDHASSHSSLERNREEADLAARDGFLLLAQRVAERCMATCHCYGHLCEHCEEAKAILAVKFI